MYLSETGLARDDRSLVGLDCREDRIGDGLHILGSFRHSNESSGVGGYAKIACCRAGLGESWVRLAGKGCSGRTAKRVSGAPEWRGESGQLGFAFEGHRLPAAE